MNKEEFFLMLVQSCPYTTDEMRGAFYEGLLKGATAERIAILQIVEKIDTPETRRLAYAIKDRMKK